MLRPAVTTRWAAGVLAVLLAVGAVATHTAARQPRPGALDPTFGRAGKVVTTTADRRVFVADVANAGRGHMVVAANGARPGFDPYGGRLLVLRYDRRGRLVRRFGHRGVAAVTLPVGPATADAVAVQPGGRIVVAGSAGGRDAQDLLVARFNPDGSLDSSFGTGGVKTSDFGGSSESAADVAVQPDGAVVVVGSVGFEARRGEAVVARYLSDGSPDPSFGAGGVTRIGSQDQLSDTNAEDVALTREGQILVAGNVERLGSSTIIITRHGPDGTLDPSLGFQGVVYLGGPGDTYVRDMAVERDTGRVYLAGNEWIESGGSRFYLTALRPDLTRDETFGNGGVATAAFGAPLSFANALAIDRRRRVLLAGTATRFTDPGQRRARGSLALARFRRGGKLDPAFGRRGRVRIGFGRGWNVARALTIAPRGRLVVAGNIAAGAFGAGGPAVNLARLRAR